MTLEQHKCIFFRKLIKDNTNASMFVCVLFVLMIHLRQQSLVRGKAQQLRELYIWKGFGVGTFIVY